jgi:hypothetical protein
MGALQFGNQILGDAVEKEIRLRIAAEIWKGSTPSAGVFRWRASSATSGRWGAAQPFGRML